MHFSLNKQIVLICLSFLIFSSCTFYRDVEVQDFLDFQLKEMNASGVDADIVLSISNPNWYAIEIRESKVQVYLENKPVGSVNLSGKLRIPAKSVSTQVLTFHSDIKDIQQLFGSALTLMFKNEYHLKGEGYVTGKAIGMKRKVPVNFEKDLTKKDLGF